MELQHYAPRWLWWVISGAFLLLPFLYFNLWFLLPLGLSLWLYLISKSGLKELTIASFFVGLMKYGGGIFWFWETYPIPGATMLAAWKQVLMIGFFWSTIAGSMAVGFCIFAIATSYLIRQKKWMFVWPALFVLSEILSSFLFSIFTAGPGSYLNANFSFGYIGLPLANLTALFPVIKISGLYGLSFLVAVLGLVLFYIAVGNKIISRRLQYALSFGLLTLLVVSFLFPPPPIKTLGKTVIAVETRFDKNSYDDPQGLYIKRESMVEAANVAIQFPSDVVLMPEDSRLTESTAGIADNLEALLAASPKTKLVVDTFRSEDIPDQAVLRAVYYDLENATTTVFDKQYMVPIGEFVMNFQAWSLNLLGQSNILDQLTHNQNYVPGPKKRQSTLLSDYPGFLFCFEGTIPSALFQMKSNQNTKLVLHPISHGWFHNPDIFWQNVDAMLRVQSIWSNLTIVSAGNMSPSKVYYPDGVISTGKIIFETEYWRLVEYNL